MLWLPGYKNVMHGSHWGCAANDSADWSAALLTRVVKLNGFCLYSFQEQERDRKTEQAPEKEMPFNCVLWFHVSVTYSTNIDSTTLVKGVLLLV